MTDKELRFLIKEVKEKLKSNSYNSEGHLLSEVKLMNKEIPYDFQMTTIDEANYRIHSVDLFGFSIKNGFIFLKTGWTSNGKVIKPSYPLHEQPNVEQFDLFFVVDSKGKRGSFSAKTGNTRFKLFYLPDWEAERELARWKEWINK